MNFRFAHPIPSKVLLVLLALLVAAILFAGLSTKGFRFHNDVGWIEEGPGLEFGEHGLAYTEAVLTGAQFSSQLGLTLELALQALRSDAPGFRFIAVVHDGDDRSQLLVGQWQDTIIVMSGDDYSHRRRTPRVSVKIDEFKNDAIQLTIVSDLSGTSIYLNGERRARAANLSLAIPGEREPARLVLGNSMAGTEPWSGRILGVALHAKALEAGVIGSHYEGWRASGSFAGFVADRPRLLYPLTEGEGQRASDLSGFKDDLVFPPDQTFVRREVFSPYLGDGAMRGSFVWDVIVNVLGFVPLGSVLAALLGRRVRIRWALAITVAIGFGLSFGIEYAQSWMPSRSSSILDLILNTAGTALGAVGLLLFQKTKPTSGAGTG